MTFRNMEASYGAAEELEWPDLWENYERAVRSLAEAHERPCRKFGISEAAGGPLIHQLRVLDPKGEYLINLQRRQQSLRKAEDALRRQLKRLPEGWTSAKVLDRISCLFDLEGCTVTSSLCDSTRLMKVDNQSLVDLVSMAKTRHGFQAACAAFIRVGTREARAAIAEVAHHYAEKPDHLTALSDAAVEISVGLRDIKVIPILVNRLVASYGSNLDGHPKTVASLDDPSTSPETIVTQLMDILETRQNKLPDKLLVQLSGLGMVDPVDVSQAANPHLGVEQAIITRDLQPVRLLARRELEQRKLAS